jgi:hypothetical protein
MGGLIGRDAQSPASKMTERFICLNRALARKSENRIG